MAALAQLQLRNFHIHVVARQLTFVGSPVSCVRHGHGAAGNRNTIVSGC
jgi:hypothetical protein